MEFKDVEIIASKLNGIVTSEGEWQNEIVSAFEDSREIIISRQAASNHSGEWFQVYENHPDAPIIFVRLKETKNGELEISAEG